MKRSSIIFLTKRTTSSGKGSKLFSFSSILLGVLFIWIFFSCNSFDRKVPFPKEETEYPKPVTKAFQFTESIPIQWDPEPSSLAIETHRLSLDDIPSTPFDLGEPIKLQNAFEESPFDWNGLPETDFNLENLPTDTLENKIIKLLPPKVINAGWPTYTPLGSRGVLDADPIGLPGPARAYLQDPSGALWIGTTRGLCRYDGAYLEIFGLEQGLPNIDILTLFRDNQNRIWIGTKTGITYILDEKKESIELLEKLNPGFGGQTFSIYQDDQGLIWFTELGQGVYIYNPENHIAKQLKTDQGLVNDRTVMIRQDQEGNHWITTINGINILNLQKNKIKTLREEQGLFSNFSPGYLQSKSGEIWLAQRGGISVLNQEKNTIRFLDAEKFPYPNQSGRDLSGMYEDSEGKIWIATNSNLVFALDPQMNQVERFFTNQDPSTIIFDFHEDKEGQIWVGGDIGGTPVINKKTGKVGSYTDANGLGDGGVWSNIQTHDGKIWAGSTNGLNIYDPETGTVQYVSRQNGLQTNSASYLLEDQNGLIWIGSNGRMLEVLDVKNNRILVLKKEKENQQIGLTISYEDPDGSMWAGTSDGELLVISLEKKTIKKILNVPASWDKTYINSMQSDHQGQLWITSSAGAIIISKDRKSMKFLNSDQGLIDNYATALLEDSNQNMWIATGGGINILNSSQDSMSSLTINEGLGDNGSFTLNENKGKMFVGTTSGLTILTPSKNNEAFNAITLGKEQGLGAIDFAENSGLFTKDGKFWVGVEGTMLLVFDSLQMSEESSSPLIAGINLFDKPLYFRERSTLTEDNYLIQNEITWDSLETTYYIPINLELPYDQNYLSFNYSGMQLSNPDKVRYRYILEGIDKQWSPITNKTISENYRDLPAGDYTFKVASRGINGIWSEPAAISFVITPPWWKTWWMYALYFIAFVGAILGYTRLRSQALIRQNLILEEKVKIRTNELRESLNNLKETQLQLIQSEKMASLGELTAGIAHEIQNPLNFVNNFSEVSNELIDEMNEELEKGDLEEVKAIATDLKENLSKINHHGKRADSIVKGMLQHSRSNSGEKVETNINLLADEYLRLSYHGLRAKDKSFNSDYKLELDTDLPKIKVNPQDIGRVILNLVNNAFYAVSEKAKNAGEDFKPEVIVSTKKTENGIQVSVHDNGTGIPDSIKKKIFLPFFTTKPTGSGTGLGLSLSYDIVQANGGNLSVESEEGKGTSFNIFFPK
ncbi:sensor histidine kinase [Algoriphagus zhangzhouensis]|uniref:histidine kinase n=1 Tax=Algoriphagus zhangzhouensis TaxID=1073327 RepID=A0A1M7Z9N9_9BACT|nr:two-component regulator propeller domain-containing protein [Algoriphagus zhangzhouensis]TDY47322.1 two component regulator with propeller domain [Algoriphagus zhangzhouensis]SHO61658.1 Two component regulator propeller [Algoriphagus zhangzhouensis]